MSPSGNLRDNFLSSDLFADLNCDLDLDFTGIESLDFFGPSDPIEAVGIEKMEDSIHHISTDELVKPTYATPQPVTTSGKPDLASRQSSLTEEWFGNVNIVHPNDISIDSSLDALFQNEDITDFGPVDIDSHVDLPSKEEIQLETLPVQLETIPKVAESSSSSKSVLPVGRICGSTCVTVTPDFRSHTITTEDELKPSTQTLGSCCAAQKLSAVQDKRLPVRGPQASAVLHKAVTRKRRLSSESRDSDDSDEESQSTASEGTAEELLHFARQYLADGCRSKPYFWQYNAQSRGPKGLRLCNTIELEDSHVVPDFMDPVFGSRWQMASFQHSGKARHGDGNDPRPDPRKLLSIGCHIWKLETEFRAIGQESSGDGSNRSAANRQKNKLASRICRLKKKALHAANKIKLDGLKQEHNQLMKVIKSIVIEMERCISSGNIGKSNLCCHLDNLIHQHLTFMIGGHTVDYVNTELEKVARLIVSSGDVLSTEQSTC